MIPAETLDMLTAERNALAAEVARLKASRDFDLDADAANRRADELSAQVSTLKAALVWIRDKEEPDAALRQRARTCVTTLALKEEADDAKMKHLSSANGRQL